MVKPESMVQRIFQRLASHGEVALSALAREVGLRPPTLAGKLRPLGRRELVVYSKDRKRVGINPAYGYVVGVDLGGSHLHYALADFRGEIFKDTTVKVRPEDGPHKMIQQMKEQIRFLAKEAGRRKLLALAVGVPSPVDTEQGVVAWANNLPGWTNIRLGRELEKAFRVPIFMENDANMAAIGEHWRGVARGVKNFVFVALGTGIGSGVFVDGKLLHGRTGSAGEVFRMNLEWNRWDEEFPDTGYFENYVAGLGIAAAGRKVLGAPTTEDAGLREERDAYFVFQEHREGNPQATAVLERVFTILGVGISNVVAVLDPELIVFGGGIAKGAPDLMLATVEKVVRRIQKEITPPFKLSSLGDKAQTYGAIASALTVAAERISARIR